MVQKEGHLDPRSCFSVCSLGALNFTVFRLPKERAKWIPKRARWHPNSAKWPPSDTQSVPKGSHSAPAGTQIAKSEATFGNCKSGRNLKHGSKWFQVDYEGANMV